MATAVNRKEIHIKDLLTRSVSLYPSSALVSREIPDIELLPGSNEIEIYGLTPTLNEHSVKVDGAGSASITDITVDLVQNKESFEQVYPDDIELNLSDSEDDSSEDEEEARSNESASVKALRADVKKLEQEYTTEVVRGSPRILSTHYTNRDHRP